EQIEHLPTAVRIEVVRASARARDERGGGRRSVPTLVVLGRRFAEGDLVVIDVDAFRQADGGDFEAEPGSAGLKRGGARGGPCPSGDRADEADAGPALGRGDGRCGCLPLPAGRHPAVERLLAAGDLVEAGGRAYVSEHRRVLTAGQLDAVPADRGVHPGAELPALPGRDLPW